MGLLKSCESEHLEQNTQNLLQTVLKIKQVRIFCRGCTICTHSSTTFQQQSQYFPVAYLCLELHTHHETAWLIVIYSSQSLPSELHNPTFCLLLQKFSGEFGVWGGETKKQQREKNDKVLGPGLNGVVLISEKMTYTGRRATRFPSKKPCHSRHNFTLKEFLHQRGVQRRNFFNDNNDKRAK
eukprot:g71065.t1